jgi:hypothetical protein
MSNGVLNRLMRIFRREPERPSTDIVLDFLCRSPRVNLGWTQVAKNTHAC